MLLHFLFDEKQNNNNNNNNGRLYIFCLFVFCIPFFYYSPVSQSLPLSTSLLSSSMPSFMYRWLNIIFFLSLVCCLIIFFLSFFGRFVFFPLFSRRNPSIRKKQQPTDRQHQQQSNMCPLPRFIPPVVQVCLLCIDRVVCLQSKKPMKRGLWSKTRARYKQNKKWYKLSNCEPFIPLQFPSALSDLDFLLFLYRIRLSPILDWTRAGVNERRVLWRALLSTNQILSKSFFFRHRRYVSRRPLFNYLSLE